MRNTFVKICGILVCAFLFISPVQAQEPQCTTATQAEKLVQGQGGKVEKIIKRAETIDMVSQYVSAPFNSSVVGELVVYSKPDTKTFAMAFYGKDGCLLAIAQLQEHHLQAFFGSEWREYSI